MTEIIRNLITDFAGLSFGWGAWVIFIFAIAGAGMIVGKIVKSIRKAVEKRKKKQSKTKKGGK